MTLDEFVAKWTGKLCDFDGKYGAQCVDLARQYIKDVWQGEQPEPTGEHGAKVLWDDPILAKYCTRIEAIDQGRPKPGDLIIWGMWPENVYGHVAICLDALKTGFVSFDQNWAKDPKLPTALPRKVAHSYIHVLGWWRKNG